MTLRPKAPKQDLSNWKICQVQGCGRLRFSKKYCQTHHRHVVKTGEARPIRPYRPRSKGTVRYSGLSLSAATVEAIERIAVQRHLSRGAAIAFALEIWLAQETKPKPVG